MLEFTDLPTVNAGLNVVSACLLVLGFVQIKRRHKAAHRNVMVSAVVCSILFLVSYLIYHYQVGSTPFQGQGGIRTVYFAILISHTILAAAVPILVALTVSFAVRGRFTAHRKIARWTLPIWLYVSVTGVAVYWMLYQL